MSAGGIGRYRVVFSERADLIAESRLLRNADGILEGRIFLNAHLKSLPWGQLQSIALHEAAHLERGDQMKKLRRIALGAAASIALSLAAALGFLPPAGALASMALLWALWWVWACAANRESEFAADAWVVRLGYGVDLAGALTRLHCGAQYFTASWSHPSPDDRVKAILGAMQPIAPAVRAVPQ